MPSGGNRSTRHAKSGFSGALGAAIRNERFDRVGHKMPKNLGATDCPKNAHMVPSWEDMDEEAQIKQIAQNTSVTDQDDLGALLGLADLAERDFTAQRQNVRIVDPAAVIQRGSLDKLPDELKKLPIPTRPAWSRSMTAEEVDRQEKLAFLEWRRGLAKVEEGYDVTMTPFEKNLEFWRQLWRVVEKSDVVVQVVDARNPLLYRCEALEDYVKAVGAWKGTVLLFNKADLLPRHVRVAWGRFLDRAGVRYFFFAAKDQIARNEEAKRHLTILEEGGELSEDEGEGEEKGGGGAHPTREEEEEGERRGTYAVASGGGVGEVGEEGIHEEHTCRVMNAEELVNALEAFGRECCVAGGRRLPEDYPDADTRSAASGASSASRHQSEYVMIGFVGYPNVGKSSTVNALLGRKRVGVTSTPGKTKHFQTLALSEGLMLCDCPGLVFPSVVSSRAEMVCGGILPLNALRDHVAPMELLSRRIPREVFEEAYNIVLPSKMPDGSSREYISWQEITAGYAVSRGMLTAGTGQPDSHTASIKLLRDYVTGKLRFCHAPPGIEDVAAGPVDPADRTTAAEEKAKSLGQAALGQAAAAAAAAAAGGAAGGGGEEAGVAVGAVKERKNRNGRANRGLSAGAFAEDPEAALFEARNVPMVRTAGKKKQNSGVMDFTRVNRPFATAPAGGGGVRLAQ